MNAKLVLVLLAALVAVVCASGPYPVHGYRPYGHYGYPHRRYGRSLRYYGYPGYYGHGYGHGYPGYYGYHG